MSSEMLTEGYLYSLLSTQSPTQQSVELFDPTDIDNIPQIEPIDHLNPLQQDQLSQIPENQQQSTKQLKRKKKKDKPASQACVICSHDHASCDDARPCKRCVSKGFPHLCKNPERSRSGKKGRPSRVQDKYASIVAADAAQSNNGANNNGILFSSTLSFNSVAEFGDFSSRLSQSTTNNGAMISNSHYNPHNSTSTAIVPSFSPTTFLASPIFSPSSPLIDQILQRSDLDLLAFDTPSPQISPMMFSDATSPKSDTTPPQQQQKQQPECNLLPMLIEQKTAGETPKNEVDRLKEACDSTDCFCPTEEEAIRQLFAQLSIRSNGRSENSPEMRYVTAKVNMLRNMLNKHMNTLEDLFPARFMSLQAHCQQVSHPMILCIGLFIMGVNAAACELFRMKKQEMLDKTFLFNLFSPDDVIRFMKKWADSVVDFLDVERMRIKIEAFGNTKYDCILSGTFHRDANTGCPLMESYVLLRYDDLV